MNQIPQNTDEFIELQKNFYFNKWRGCERACPAFQNEIVYATRAGWEHINNSKRTLSELCARLELLPHAKKLLEKSTTYQAFKKDKDGITKYWNFTGFIRGNWVTVIVRQKGPSPKHVYSVYTYSRPKDFRLGE
ncbi:MAG: hypothetical protein PHO48_04820 [Candidatus Gracilibacteria bacterium]|nr:hypothetical protein [Candidatus Gracilibacteria bacterium]MDD5179371.1 hypothetical protein [Candidatus Gracilibacteria bacterium]